ncbi:MAG: hypothetical protein JO332_01235 [Planctomycetaceae bacterium]|nr:hypothetical protein [Planctomycetaceae bacterium]
MKYLPFLALLCCTAGCGLFGSSEPEKKSAPADSREAERAELRGKLDQRKQELAQADADLGKIATEREQLANEGASEKKTSRLVELARLESDLKQRKASLGEEIDQLQQQLGGPAAPRSTAKPEKAGDALDDILAGNDNKEKEDAERRKKKAEEEAAGDKNRIAAAESARKAELDERAKQKVEGGRLAAGADGPAFEERWADVINKVREEIQKFKKW